MSGQYLIALPIMAGLAVIPPLLLAKKGRRFVLWYAYALLLFPFAMIHAIVQKEKNSADIFELKGIIQSILEPPIPREETSSFTINDHIRYFDPLSPVEVEQVFIKVNPALREVSCRLSFRNIGDKEIEAIKLDLFCYNAFGEETGPPVEVLVQDCAGVPGMIFGPKHYIKLEDHENTRRINAVLRRIVYSDGLLWEAKEGNLRSCLVDPLEDPDELEQLKRQAGADAVCYARKNLDGWVCVCGRINMGGNRLCMRCKRSRDTVLTRFDRPHALQSEVTAPAAVPAVANGGETSAKMQSEYEIRQTLSDSGAFAGGSSKLGKLRIIIALFIVVLLAAAGLGLATDFSYSYTYYKAKQANQVQPDGRTPLTAAVIQGNPGQVEALIAQGAEVDRKDGQGQSALEIALSSQDTGMCGILLSHGAMMTPEQRNAFMQMCILRGDTDTLGIYLAAEKLPAFVIDSTDSLLAAASAGHNSIVELFLDYGANIEDEDSTGQTPLSLAVNAGHAEVVETLVYDGADVNKTDINGELPLVTAAKEGRLDIVKLLVLGGADTDKKNKYGWTAREAADSFDHDDVVKYLRGLD